MTGLVVLVLVTAACGRGGKEESKPASKGGGALVTGPGFDQATNTIKLGLLTALSGPLTSISDPLDNGIKALVAEINGAGGIAGRYRLDVVSADTRYDANTAVQQYQSMRDQVAMFVQIFGTPSVNAVLPQLKADNVVASPGSLDDHWIRELNLVPYSAPYQMQFLNAASYYLDDLGGRGKTICALAIDGPYGDAGLQGIQTAAGADNFTLKASPRYASSETEFTGQVTQLRDSGCQAVFLTSLPASTGAILGTAVKLGFRPQWFVQSSGWDPALAASDELRSVIDRDFLLVSEGTEWGDESVPGMKRMMDDVRRYAPDQKPDLFFTAGFLAAWAVEAALAKAVELGDISRAGLLDAQRKLGKVSFGGLSGDYTYGPPEQRDPSRTNTVFKVNRTKPALLEAVKKNFTSPAAQNFRFAG